MFMIRVSTICTSNVLFKYPTSEIQSPNLMLCVSKYLMSCVLQMGSQRMMEIPNQHFFNVYHRSTICQKNIKNFRPTYFKAKPNPLQLFCVLAEYTFLYFGWLYYGNQPSNQLTGGYMQGIGRKEKSTTHSCTSLFSQLDIPILICPAHFIRCCHLLGILNTTGVMPEI